MNEKQIEIAVVGLSKLWKQTKTQIGKQRIERAAKALKQGLSGSLIPLSWSQSDTVSVKPNEYYTEPIDYLHHGALNPANY